MSAIPVGYKQTEVGVIPQEWEVARLASVSRTSVQNGVFNEPARKGRGCKLINVGDLYTAAPIDTNNLEKFDATKGEVSKFGVTHGDLFFTRSSITPDGIAHCNIYDQTIQEDIVFDCHIIRVQADNKKADPFFLANFCVTKPARIYLVANAKTTTMTTVDQSVIGGLPVPLPPLPEQRAIAAALSDVDALLAKLDQLIVKKCNLKQAAMQQLLTGQTRLPGFSGAWHFRPLGDVVANLEAGVSVNSVEHGKPLGSGEPCILKTSAIFDGRFDPEECKLIDRRDINRAKLNPRRDTIIISRMNTPNLVGEVGYVPNDFPTLNLPDRLWMTRFDPSAKTCPRWLAYVMCSPNVKEVIKGLATGTSGSMKNIAKGALLAMQLAFPSGTEQTAIATVLSDMDTELAALEGRRDKTRALKQGMMQELLTGRIRLV